MTKARFILSLHDKLSDLPRNDIEERLSFYSEMIDDRMEEGHSEEEAVTSVGSVDEIVAQIRADIGSDKPGQKKRSIWEVILLVLGSPLWLSLLIAVLAVVISLYAVLWSVVISLWAIFGSVVGSTIGVAGAAVAFALDGNAVVCFAMFAVCLTCTGLAILLFLGSKGVTKGASILTKASVLWIKNGFKKEDAQ